MTPQQWTLVEHLYHEASSVPARERDFWLARACGGDGPVRREVESLRAQNASTPDALDDGARAGHWPIDDAAGLTLMQLRQTR